MGKQGQSEAAERGRVRAPTATRRNPHTRPDQFEQEADVTAELVMRRRGRGPGAGADVDPVQQARSTPLIAASPSRIAPRQAVIRRTKTAPTAGFRTGGHHPLIPTQPGGGVFDVGDSDAVKDQKVFDLVQGTYRESLAKGRRNWGRLLNQLIRLGRDREALVAELRARRATYAQRWEQDYSSSPKRGLNEGVLVETYGQLGPGQQPPAAKPRGYKNTMYPQDDTISAEGNYANDDPARLRGQGLNNSEILWRQYLDTVRAKYGLFEEVGGHGGEGPVEAKMAQLSHLVRKNLQNRIVQRVAYFSYPDGTWWNTDRQWTPDDEEFFALLGTPNVAAAAYLLADHADELGGKTIERIVTTADQHIDIVFGAAPEVEELEWDLRYFMGAPIASAVLGPTDLGTTNPLMQPPGADTTVRRIAAAADAGPLPAPTIHRRPQAPIPIQRRFIDGAEDWVTASGRQKSSGEDYERSPDLLAIDQAVATFLGARAAAADAPTLVAHLTTLLGAISDWEGEKRTVFGGVWSRRAADVAQLKAEAIAERVELNRRVAQMDAIRGGMQQLDDPVASPWPPALATFAMWLSDRRQLKLWVDEGLRQADDPVLRNSCEWLIEDNARLFNVIPTHDSSERVRRLEPDEATASSIAWFPFPAAPLPGAVGCPVAGLYNAADQTDPAWVYPDHGGHGTEGWNTQGVVVVTHSTITRGRDAVWQTLKHEVQHDADRHRSPESKRGVTLAEQAVADLPAGGEITLESLTAQATAHARLAAERALITYKTEYRAYSYMGDPAYDLPHDVAHPSEQRYQLQWTPRQLAIFEHIRSAYPDVRAAWESENWTRERHLRQSTSGSLVEPEVIEEFRRRVNEYRDPDVEGANKLNSRRIDALNRALDAVPVGTSNSHDPLVVAVLGAVAALDEEDRRYVRDEASSPALHAKIDRHLDGNAWVDALFAISGSGGG